MAKRKTGPRHPCGKLKQPTAQDRAKTEAEVYRANMQQVASQPHRRGFRDPLSPRLENALGRFCERLGLRDELYEAGKEYADTMRRWRTAKGCPDALHNGGIGSGLGPSDATIDKWWRDIERVEVKLRARGNDFYLAARHVCLDNADLPDSARSFGWEALTIVAEELGWLPVGAHPFIGRAA